MRGLIDANLALRLAEVNHPSNPAALAAITRLNRRGDDLCIVPQACYELWTVATRPAKVHGLGWDTRRAAAEVTSLKRLFTLCPDVAGILAAWEQLVVRYDTKGKTAHDARRVAAMVVHGIDAILTFNVRDFNRYAGIGVLDPVAVAVGSVP